MDIFQAFGLDIKLLAANLVNFLILVAILHKFAYRPILKFVKDRQEKIEKGIKEAELATKKLSEAVEKKKEILSDAHKEAQEVIKKAKDQAIAQSRDLVKKTKQETAQIVEKAKKDILLEKEISILSEKKEITSAIMAALEKILSEKIGKKDEKKFIENAIKDIK